MATGQERDIEAIVEAIKGSKKFRTASAETIRHLAQSELGRHKNHREVEKAVRKRLHKIMAPFLGDPDYTRAGASLQFAFAAGDPAAVRVACAEILASHVSTRERLPVLADFYNQVFALTGKPGVLLDIACALNPLSYPWMGLPAEIRYFAYDVHELRVEFLNAYFTLQGLPPLARVQDIALHFPEEEGGVAFFMKELHRFEENYPGRGLPLLEALRARYLVVTLPTVSLYGRRSLTQVYRRFFYRIISGKDWQVQELLFPSELVFCIDKGGDR